MPVVNFISDFVRKQIRRLTPSINKLFKGRLTPNIVTTVSTAMHLPIALLIANDHFLWAAALLAVFGLCDVLDGELARLQGSDSARGMLYDATSDRIKETMLYSGIAYWLSNVGDARWVWLPVVACGVSISVSYAKAKGEAALALKRQISDHHKLNRHFKEGLVPFEVRMTIIFLGLVSGQMLFATGTVALLATLTIYGRLKTIGEEI